MGLIPLAVIFLLQLFPCLRRRRRCTHGGARVVQWTEDLD